MVDVFYRQNKALPTFRAGQMIPIREQNYNLTEKEGAHFLDFGLGSKEWDGVSRFTFELRTRKLDGSQRKALDMMISGEWKRGTITLKRDKRNRIFATIPYTKPLEENHLNPDRIVGVDLGVAKAFYCALSDSPARLCPKDADLLHGFRMQIRKRRREYQNQYQMGARKGRGRKAALKPLEKLSLKERNFRDTLYHRYSKAIVDFAVKHQAGTIQIEDLDGLKQAKQGNWLLDGWAVGDLQLKLKYKAKEQGVKIVEVNPRYTSQRCSACGYISRENRENQATFVCKNCGCEENADYNAACNLSIPGIDDIITKTLETGTAPTPLVRKKTKAKPKPKPKPKAPQKRNDIGTKPCSCRG